MTQTLTEAPATGRAANRQRKRREYIDTAIRIVLNGGLEALTMQALAREMGAAVGTAYTYFASKSALVAELQVLAIGRLTSTYSEVAPRWQGEMGRLDAKGKAEAGMTLLVEFVVRAPKSMRDDFFLQQLLLTDGGRSILPEDQATVLEAAGEWSQVVKDRLDEAMEAGVLDKSNDRRTAKFAAVLSGAALFNNLPEDAIGDLPGLTRSLTIDLLCSWGADRKRLTRSATKAQSAADKLELAAPALG